MKKLAMEHFYEHFRVGDIVKKSEVANYLSALFPEINPATLEWRIYDLKKEKYLLRIGRDTFEVTNNTSQHDYRMDIDGELVGFLKYFNRYVSTLKKKDPSETEVNISVWNTDFLNQFMTHQIFRNFTIIEIDEYRVESLFKELKARYRNVIPYYKIKDLDYLLTDEKQVYLVMKLPKRSPLMNKKSQRNHFVSSPRPEKILVDVTVYKSKILPIEDSEVINIYRNMMREFPMNKSSILNYARVRGMKTRKEVENMLMISGE